MTLTLMLVLLAQAPSGPKAIKAADAAMNAADFERALTLLQGIDPKKTAPKDLLRAHLLRAECLLALQRPEDAESAYADAIRLDAGIALPPGGAPKARALFDRVKARMTGTLKVSARAKGAMASLDGKRIGPLPVESVVLAGSHLLELDSKEAAPREVNVPAGGTVSVSLDAVDEPSGPADREAAPTVTARPAPAKSSSLRAASYVVGGVGVAALAGSAVTAGLTFASYKETEAASKGTDLAAFETARSATKTRAAVADALLGVGAAALGTAVILYFVSDAPASAALVPSAGGATLVVEGRLW